MLRPCALTAKDLGSVPAQGTDPTGCAAQPERKRGSHTQRCEEKREVQRVKGQKRSEQTEMNTPPRRLRGEEHAC